MNKCTDSFLATTTACLTDIVTSYQTSPRPGAKTNPVWLIGILCIHSLVQALADKTWQVSSCKQTAFLVWSWLFWQLSCEILYTSVAGIKAIRTPRFLIYETAYADWNLLLYSLFLRKWSLHCCCWAFLHRVDWGPIFQNFFYTENTWNLQQVSCKILLRLISA